jgi:type VI secretion system protein ImpH
VADTCGRQTINLKEDILESAEAYDFYQAVKILDRLTTQDSSSTGQPSRLRIQPELNLDYPNSDIAEISNEDDQGYLMTTTFFGLYGVSSPLPGFYTEELLDDDWDELHSRKDMFDVIHNQVYPLLYRAWLKYKFSHNTVELEDSKYWEIIFDLAGLGDAYRQDKSRYSYLARYAGILGQRNKSLLGLKTLLKERLQSIAVEIKPCVKRKVSIVRHQRCMLGKQNAMLGKNACIGKEITDRNGKFLVEIGPVEPNDLLRFGDQGELIAEIKNLIHIYLVQPLAYSIILLLGPGASMPLQLGMTHNSTLGSNCWLIDKPNQDVQAVELYQIQDTS